MLRSCFSRCFGQRDGDQLLWNMDLRPHATGEFSMSVVQANSSLEDQSQVYASPSATYVGVYDGHGGPEASRFVNRHLFRYLQKFSNEQGGFSADVFRKAFNATENDFTSFVKQTMPVKPKIVSVGSCCLVGGISDGKLFVANLGDSRAVLGRRGIGGEKDFVAERLSTDHNVSCENVRREVEALHPDDATVVVYCRGAWRIRGIIQVSRSIGDVYLKKPEFHRDPVFQQHAKFVPMKRALLSAEPSIVTRKLQPQDLFIIFASDGLWEHISDDEAVRVVSKHPRAGIAKRLVAAALEEAARKRELPYKDIKKIEKGIRRHFHDDITVIVVYLDHLTPPSSHTPHKASGTYNVSPPIDIYAHNSKECVGKSTDKILPTEESRLEMIY